MRTSCTLLTLGFFFCALSGAWAASGVPWVELAEPQYGFKVRMPERPEEVMTRKNYHVGHVVNHIYTATQDGQVFRVDVSELPHVAVRFVGADTILDNARSGVLHKELGKQVSYANVRLGSLQGKALVYDTVATNDHPGMRGEARIFLQENKLYLAEVITPKSRLPGNAKKFFDSFQVQ